MTSARTDSALVTVITVEDEGVVYGVNAWKANPKDIRKYQEQE